MKRTAANIVREYGPFPGITSIHGVSYDGTMDLSANGSSSARASARPTSSKTVSLRPRSRATPRRASE